MQQALQMFFLFSGYFVPMACEWKRPTAFAFRYMVHTHHYGNSCQLHSTVATIPALAVAENLSQNDHGYVPLVRTVRSLFHSQLITGFVTRVTRRVPPVEQELLTHPEHMSSSLVFSGVRVSRSLFVLFLLAIVLSVFL